MIWLFTKRIIKKLLEVIAFPVVYKYKLNICIINGFLHFSINQLENVMEKIFYLQKYQETEVSRNACNQNPKQNRIKSVWNSPDRNKVGMHGKTHILKPICKSYVNSIKIPSDSKWILKLIGAGEQYENSQDSSEKGKSQGGTCPLSINRCCAVLCHVWLFVNPWNVARQDILSMGTLQARILEWVRRYYKAIATKCV